MMDFFVSIKNCTARLYKFLGARIPRYFFDRVRQTIGNNKITQDPNFVIPER